MGLISAATGSISNVVGDQFKEFVTCPSSDKNVLVQRGLVQHGDANTNPTAGVISNGSKIVVPSGYAMMIIDNGAIKEFTAEPGEFIWDSSSEPSVFEGGFFKGIGDSIKKIGERITYGGQAARDQRVYYVNLLNILGNKFGSTNTETISDPVYGSVEITYFGEYSFKVVDPAVLVANLIGANPADTITVNDVVGGQLKLQFSSNVSTCISNLMVQNNISFNKVQGYKNEVVTQMNTLLDESWRQQYGLEIQDVALNINASEESKAAIREVDQELSRLQRMGNLYSQNPSGLMAAATAEAMTTAAGNEGGAMVGLMGMNMATQAGANVMQQAAAMTPTPAPAPTPAPVPTEVTPVEAPVPVKEATEPVTPTPEAATTTAAPKFCSNCGTPATGKFCSNCGTQLVMEP